jgi:hypothetical protein
MPGQSYATMHLGLAAAHFTFLRNSSVYASGPSTTPKKDIKNEATRIDQFSPLRLP